MIKLKMYHQNFVIFYHIIIIDLITLLSICVLGKLFSIFGGIRISQGKEIHPIP